MGHPSRVHPEADAFTQINVGCDFNQNIACVSSFGMRDVEAVKRKAPFVFTHRYQVQAIDVDGLSDSGAYGEPQQPLSIKWRRI